MGIGYITKSTFLLRTFIFAFTLLGIFCLFISDVSANQFLKKKPKWSYSSYDELKSLNVVDSDIYIQTPKELVLYNADGVQLWKFQPYGDKILRYKVEDKDIIYVQTTDTLYALNWDGTERWYFQVNSNEKLKSFKISNDGTIFVLTSTELYSIDPVDGEENWHFTQGSETKNFKVLDDGMIYVVTLDSVYAFDSFSNS